MKLQIPQGLLCLLNILIYGYLGALVILMAILWLTGDRWWFGTVLLYGPRWIYAVPLAILIPLAILLHRRWLWPLGICAFIIAWPIMGFNIPATDWFSSAQPEFRVLTYNVHRWDISGEDFATLFEETGADFAAVQECASPKRFKKALPEKWFSQSAGYSIIVSRYPIRQCETSQRGREVNGLYCVLEIPTGPVGFGNADLLTPRRALKTILDRRTIFDLTQVEYAQKRIAQRWEESQQLYDWLASFPEDHKVIAGDFNLTADSPIFRDIWSPFSDAFSHTGWGYGYTKMTRINIFRYRSKIDHILSSKNLKPLKSWIGPDLGSDHLPLFAEFSRQ